MLTVILNAISFFQPAPVRSVRLTHLYETYNDSYFDGKLPNNVIVYVDGAEGNVGLTDRCNGTALCIHLNGYYNNSAPTEELTLLHESCHVYVLTAYGEQFDSHGPLWQSCMHNLARTGALD